MIGRSILNAAENERFCVPTLWRCYYCYSQDDLENQGESNKCLQARSSSYLIYGNYFVQQIYFDSYGLASYIGRSSQKAKHNQLKYFSSRRAQRQTELKDQTKCLILYISPVYILQISPFPSLSKHHLTTVVLTLFGPSLVIPCIDDKAFLYLSCLKYLALLYNDSKVMNEILVEHQTNLTVSPEITIQPSENCQWDILLIIRSIFYIIVFLKILQISFFKRKKANLKERVYKKFLYAHNEMFRYFTDEDRQVMELTLNNTVKNATVQIPKHKRTRANSKKVNFEVERNQYHVPKQIVEKNQMEHENQAQVDKYFQALRTSPPKDQCIMKLGEEHPSRNASQQSQRIQTKDKFEYQAGLKTEEQQNECLLHSELAECTVQSKGRQGKEEEGEDFQSLL